MADRSEMQKLRAGAALDQSPHRVPGMLRRNIDHPLDRVCTPQRPTRSADHFDAFKILQHVILQIPKYSGKKRRVDRPAINQHQQLVVHVGIETAGTDRPIMWILLCHVERTIMDTIRGRKRESMGVGRFS